MSAPTWHIQEGEDIVRATSNGGRFLSLELLKMTRVRQFGLYPLWTLGNLRGFGLSKKLLLGTVMCHDNMANNGETFICLDFRICHTSVYYVIEFV